MCDGAEASEETLVGDSLEVSLADVLQVKQMITQSRAAVA